MLDEKGYRDFTHLNHTFTRGGYSYKQPKGWIGYGIKVSRKYDNQDDSWLAMDNNPKEWAIAFHGLRSGTRSPDKILDSIINTSNNEMRPGKNQRFFDKLNDNPQTKRLIPKIPLGIYCSPLVTTAKGHTSCVAIGIENYKVVLMLRVKPRSITFSNSRPDYWVIEKPADVRPYRILVLKVESGSTSSRLTVGSGSTSSRSVCNVF